MARRKRRKNNTVQGNVDLRTVIVKIIIGSAVGVALFFMLTALASAICLKGDFSEKNYKYIVVAIGAFIGFVCGYVTVRPIRRKCVLLGAVGFVPAGMIILLFAFYFGHGGIGSVGWLFALVSMIFSALGGAVAS